MGFAPRPWGAKRDKPAPRPAPAPQPQPHVVINAAALPHVSTSTVLAVVFGLLLALVGGHDLVAHHWPVPPAPGPAPTPQPVGELRVILVSDPSQNMTKGQLDALGSTKAREWLNAHCAKDASGRPAWRSWDKDTDPSDEKDPAWKKAWDATKPILGPLPQIVIFRGQKGEALPLPDSEDGLLELLKRKAN